MEAQSARGRTRDRGTLDQVMILYTVIWMRTFFFLINTLLIFVDLSSFFETVRNIVIWHELVNIAGLPFHCARSLLGLGRNLRGKVVTTSDVSIERGLPENVVQGGIFSTLGGKSVLRLVYKEFID